MDRREALKKMMAGGAVAAGASMVSSSPVFAAGSLGAGQPMGAGLTTPAPPAATANGKRSATWRLTAPDVACSTGDLEISSYAVGATLNGDLSVLIEEPRGFGHVPGNTAAFTAVRTGPGNSPFRRGDSFELTWHVKYECMVNGQQAGCQFVDYTYRYVNQGGGNNPDWQPMPGTPWVSSSGPCAL